MRFAYVAVGVAGFLTATMIDGRVVPVSESMSRFTSFQSRSVNPYTNQQTSTSSLSRPSSTQEQTSPTLTGSKPPTGSSYADGQIVGFKAGLNSHISTGSTSQITAPTNLFTEDAQFNQGVRAGFQIGLTQHPSQLSGLDASHKRDFVQGQLAGFQTALRQHSLHQGRTNTEKVVSPISSGNKHIDAGAQAGFEAGIRHNVHIEKSVSTNVKTDSHRLSGAQFSKSADYEAGQRAGLEFGASHGIKGSEKLSSLKGQNQQFNLGLQAGFEASVHEHVDGVSGASESVRVHTGEHVQVGAALADTRVNGPTDGQPSTVQRGEALVHASARQAVGSGEHNHVGTVGTKLEHEVNFSSGEQEAGTQSTHKSAQAQSGHVDANKSDK